MKNQAISADLEEANLLHGHIYQDDVDQDTEDALVRSFFMEYYNYAAPYIVLPDEGFWFSYMKIHGPLTALKMLKTYLDGEVVMKMTRCCYQNIAADPESGLNLVSVQVIKCGCVHKETGEVCIRKFLEASPSNVVQKFFLATSEETNVLSVGQAFPIIEAVNGLLELSMTLGSAELYNKFKGGVTGPETRVWEAQQVLADSRDKEPAANDMKSKVVPHVKKTVKEPAGDMVGNQGSANLKSKRRRYADKKGPDAVKKSKMEDKSS